MRVTQLRFHAPCHLVVGMLEQADPDLRAVDRILLQPALEPPTTDLPEPLDSVENAGAAHGQPVILGVAIGLDQPAHVLGQTLRRGQRAADRPDDGVDGVVRDEVAGRREAHAPLARLHDHVRLEDLERRDRVAEFGEAEPANHLAHEGPAAREHELERVRTHVGLFQIGSQDVQR